ncbi:UDP-glucuronosyl/UDP-glucosyltransferase [Sesbania bispinosa]|nr:UDP-glucuronosyl/UDP-glucosyltransferase [Sesbania bispinosa]
MASKAPIHILLVSFPAQGHISPLLRLGKHLAAKGFFVTFSTTESIGKHMEAANTINATPIGDGFLKFEFFNDGHHPESHSLTDCISQLDLVGKQAISQIIKNHSNTNRPISCIINNPFLSWVCDAASEHGIPCALYWIHSSLTFLASHYYFQKLSPFPTKTDPFIDVQFPNINTVLKYNEIPEFLHPFSPIPLLKTLVMQQFERLSKTFCIFMDTFEELEQDYIDYLSKFFLIRPVGPLFKNPKSLSTSTKICGDSFKVDDDCIDWLNSRSPASVVYICFGTILSLPVAQLGEIAYALLDSQVSFLWVFRANQREEALQSGVLPDGFFEKISERGSKVVEWSPQEDVLAHPSVACYFSHCGWNSTVEAVSLGVPVLTFSQFSDQVTNAKLLVDVFQVGIRVNRHLLAENVIVNRDEITKCLLEATTGPRAKELKENALKWKNAAEAARAQGGSSDRHLDAFVEDIKKYIAMNKKKIHS